MGVRQLVHARKSMWAEKTDNAEMRAGRRAARGKWRGQLRLVQDINLRCDAILCL